MSESTIQPFSELARQPTAQDQATVTAQEVTRRRYLLGLVAVALVYLLLAFGFSQITPFNKGPDEGYHLEYITFLKQNGRLPITFEERAQITRADFPPLYHLFVAVLSLGVGVDGPPKFKIFWDSFRYRAIDLQSDEVWAIETQDYQPPYLGRFLVWQIGRGLSILLSLATVVVTFFVLQETPLRHIPPAPLFGAAMLAFIPQYIFLGTALNDDNLLGLLAVLYFWFLLWVKKTPERWWPYLGLGVTLGLSLTVKYTLVVAPLELLLVGIVVARQKSSSWRWLWPRLGVVGVLALLCSSWWFGWNFWFLNTVAQDGWFVGLVSPLLAGGSDPTLNRISGFLSDGQIGLTELPANTRVGTFSGWVASTFLSFWGVSIGGTIPLWPYAYLFIALIIGIAAFGLWRVWRWEIPSRSWLLLLIFHVAIFVILPLIRFGLSRRLGQTAQGRHILIPAAAAVVGLVVWGLATALPRRWQPWIFSLIIAGLLGWSAAHLYRLDTYVAPPLPVRTLPQAAGWLPQPAGAKFGQAIELVSYELDPQPAQGELRLNLAWRSLAHVNENYLLKVALLDRQGQVVSHWQGYNGQGRLPTLAWDPGDSVFDRLILPLLDLPAGDYTVQVQLSGAAEPLSITEQGCGGAAEGGCSSHSALALTDVSLSEPSALSLPHHLSLTGPNSSTEIAFALWPAGATQPLTPEPDLPYYRYPATISIIAGPAAGNGAGLDLQLLDPAGRAWPAADSTANIYTFVIGPRWSSGSYRLKMMLWQGDQVLAQATSEPLVTIENWWKREFEVPAIAAPGEANFANQLKFLGYALPQTQVKAGQSFPLTLYWQALPGKSPQADFIQFNHLLDSTGTLRGGYDRRPLENYSTLLWAPGEIVVDGYTVPVDADAPPGQYYLNVGYYLTVGESAVNLPLVMDGQMSDVTSVTIGPIQVVQ
jgi:4-amino-4-deoxy-L-arabinose transferase-like glycosyltransferase